MEGVNAVGKRVSLLNDDAPAAGGQRTTALPLHRGPPTPPKSTNATSTATYPGPTAAVLARPALDPKPSYSSSRSSSSVTTISSYSSSAAPSSALHHNHHHHHHNHLPHPASTHLHHHPHHSHHAHHASVANKSSSISSSTSSSISPPAADCDPAVSSRDSRQSSSSSNSPHYSPAARAVPQLLRHDSTSSSQSLNTPSPMTPTAFYEPLDQGKSINGDPSLYPYATQPMNPHSQLPPNVSSQPHQAMLAAAANGSFYPASTQMPLPGQQAMYAGFPSLQQALMPDPYGMAPGPPAVQYQFATELIDTMANPAPGLPAAPVNLNGTAANGQGASADSNANGANGQQKAKKKYPCPHAVRFNCTDTFTTSGHAARHGKKHTGEKNILCPTCHKAFTRKDNMKQHERTHKNRNNNNSVDETHKTNGHSRRTQSISSVGASTLTHKSSGSTEMELDSPITDAADSKRNSLQRPSLGRPAQYTGGSAIDGSDVKADHTLQVHRPELNRQFSGESQDGEGESPGLDALAMAASELR